MKRIIILFAVISLYHIVAFGQKKWEMVIEKTDGSEVVINTEDIIKTYFREQSSENPDKQDDNNGDFTVENLIGVWYQHLDVVLGEEYVGALWVKPSNRCIYGEEKFSLLKSNKEEFYAGLHDTPFKVENNTIVLTNSSGDIIENTRTTFTFIDNNTLTLNGYLSGTFIRLE